MDLTFRKKGGLKASTHKQCRYQRWTLRFNLPNLASGIFGRFSANSGRIVKISIFPSMLNLVKFNHYHIRLERSGCILRQSPYCAQLRFAYSNQSVIFSVFQVQSSVTHQHFFKESYQHWLTFNQLSQPQKTSVFQTWGFPKSRGIPNSWFMREHPHK